jgi:hypothetical protein
MKFKALLVLVLLAVTAAACSPSGSSLPSSTSSPSAASPSSSASSNSSSAADPNIAQAVDSNTQPIQVTTTLDDSHAASAVIGPEGGTLSATGVDGSRFTLVIPPKALEETIEVGMTPITAMDGLPWKTGSLAAVQLEPDGQTFYDYVTLTIEPAGDLPPDQAIPIGASGANHNVYMPAVDPKSKSLTLKLDHFSSAGAVKGLLADIEPWRQRLGGDVEARLNSIVAAELARQRQAILSGQPYTTDPGFWDYIQKAWKQYVLDPRVAAAGESCAAGRLAIETVLAMERQFELGGVPFSSGVNWLDLVPKVGKVCIQEEYELCRDQHIVHRMIPVILGLERQNELLGVHDEGQDAAGIATALAQVEAEGWDLAQKCLHFELQFKSTATMSTADGSYTSSVEATVPIELNPNTLALEGQADLVNTSFSMKSTLCSANSNPGGGTFKAISLVFINAPPDASRPYGYVKAVHLTYAPGNTSETVIEVCPEGTTTFPPMHLWTLAYTGIHNAEVTGGGAGGTSLTDVGSLLSGAGLSNLPSVPGMPQLPGTQGDTSQASQDNGPTFLAKEWAVRGGDLFAQKQWSLTVSDVTTGSDQGTFMLYHRPQ